MSEINAVTMAPAAPLKRASVLPSLLLLAAAIASASAMRTVFSPVQEVAAADLHFNDFQMSLLQGLAISIPIGLLAIPVGRLTDRGNRALLLFCLAMLWTIGTALTVFATEFWQIFAARMLAGIGAFSSLTVANLTPASFRDAVVDAKSIEECFAALGVNAPA